MATPPVLRAAERRALVYARTWRSSVVSSFLNPVLFLAAMGLGLGSLVDQGDRAGTLAGGGGYLAFLAPGLLAANAMQTAAYEATFPIMSGIKWTGTYNAMLATPLGATDVALGELVWVVARLVLTSTIFAGVIVAFGAAGSLGGVMAAVPAAVLTGAAFAAPIAAYTATLTTDAGLSALLRFGVVPMFLFSGTFFPVAQLPAALRPVA